MRSIFALSEWTIYVLQMNLSGSAHFQLISLDFIIALNHLEMVLVIFCIRMRASFSRFSCFCLVSKNWLESDVSSSVWRKMSLRVTFNRGIHMEMKKKRQKQKNNQLPTEAANYRRWCGRVVRYESDLWCVSCVPDIAEFLCNVIVSNYMGKGNEQWT